VEQVILACIMIFPVPQDYLEKLSAKAFRRCIDPIEPAITIKSAQKKAISLPML